MRKFRFARTQRTAKADGPLFEPTAAVLPDERVWRAVREVVEGRFKSDKPVAALAQDVQQVSKVVGFEIIAMEKDDLWKFIPEEILRKLLVVIEYGIGKREIRVRDFLLQRGVTGLFCGVVKRSKGPVFGIERDRSNGVPAIYKK